MQINNLTSNLLQDYKKFTKFENKLANTGKLKKNVHTDIKKRAKLSSIKPSELKSFLSSDELKVFEEVFGLVYDNKLPNLFNQISKKYFVGKINLVL